MSAPKTLTYAVVRHYDVWGNPTDGFEVNDSSNAGTIKVPDNTNDEELLDVLYEAGITNMSGARALANGVAVTDNGTLIEIDSPEGAPLFSLHLE